MKLLKYLFIISTLITSHYVCYSQFTPYTAKLGVSTAIDFSKSDLEYSNPQLIAVATTNEDFEVDLGAFPIKISSGMDMKDGKSEAWIYVINEKGTDEVALIGVVNSFLGYQAADLTDDLKDAVPDISLQEIVNDWINTNELVTNIKKNNNYIIYKNQNPKNEPQTVGLYVNTDIQELEINQTYWITSFGKNEDFICYTNAVNGNTECDAISSVKPIEYITNSFAPNPASNNIDLKTEENVQSFISVSLFDIYGNKVFESNDPQLSNIDLTNLSTGSYSLIYDYGNRFEIEKLIIKK